MEQLIKIYRFFFSRAIFYRFNKLLYRLSLSGLGILNYENDKVSGELQFLQSYFKNNQGGTALDVGANIGNYTKNVLKFNPTAKVIGFEPHPITYKKLQKNIVSDNFKAINAAAGESEGLLSLYDYEDRDGSSHASLYKDVIENIHQGRAIEHKVNVIALGDYIESNNIQNVILLKIDTEGNELNVLKGVKKQLDEGRISAIHFEFNEMNVSSRTFFRDFWNILVNYDFYRLVPDGMVKIVKYDPLFCELFAYQNIVAILKAENPTPNCPL